MSPAKVITNPKFLEIPACEWSLKLKRTSMSSKIQSNCSTSNTVCCGYWGFLVFDHITWDMFSLLPEICFRNQLWRRIQPWHHNKRTEGPTTWEILQNFAKIIKDETSWCRQLTFEHACTKGDASEGESSEDEACISDQSQQILLEGGGPKTVALARTTIWDLNKLCRQVC